MNESVSPRASLSERLVKTFYKKLQQLKDSIVTIEPTLQLSPDDYEHEMAQEAKQQILTNWKRVKDMFLVDNVTNMRVNPYTICTVESVAFSAFPKLDDWNEIAQCESWSPEHLYTIAVGMLNKSPYLKRYDTSPIIVDTNHRVIAGAQRVFALLLLGPDFVKRSGMSEWVRIVCPSEEIGDQMV